MNGPKKALIRIAYENKDVQKDLLAIIRKINHGEKKSHKAFDLTLRGEVIGHPGTLIEIGLNLKTSTNGRLFITTSTLLQSSSHFGMPSWLKKGGLREGYLLDWIRGGNASEEFSFSVKGGRFSSDPEYLKTVLSRFKQQIPDDIRPQGLTRWADEK